MEREEIRVVTFILPGFSASNKEWVLEVVKNLDTNEDIRPVFWDHWEDPHKALEPENKAQDVIDVLLKDRANIIAKSVGTLVAAYVVGKIPDRIGKVILCGIPSVSPERLKIFQEMFRNFPPQNVMVFQNTKDPLSPFVDVRDFMENVNPEIRVIEKPASDHNYPYFSDFRDFLSTP